MPDGTRVIRESNKTATLQTAGSTTKVIHKGDFANVTKRTKVHLGDFTARKNTPGHTPPKRDVNLELARILAIHKRDAQMKIKGVTTIRKSDDIKQK